MLPAVEVRDAVKSYVKGSVVLNHMDMSVPKGTIYGLLGSSGCGKTSVLSCIVGIRGLDSGSIFVFGKKPGSKGSGIPGKRLGYMPQDIALYPNFTIREMLLYFGRIYGLTTSDILQRVEFLTTFLQLPNSSKRISSLSGGQARRTSLATALVHDPELLILDEPTVGLDPILRKSIWDHLCEMVSNGRTTVILTTHYIEEARRSNTIGLMRNGRLLAEDSPENLLRLFDVPLLENIVLKLCRADHERIKRGEDVTNTIECVVNNNENGVTVSSYPRPVARVTMGSRKSLLSVFRKSGSPKPEETVANSENCNCVVVGFDSKREQVVTSENGVVGGQTTQSPPSSPTTIVQSSSQNLWYDDSSSSVLSRINSLIRRNFIYFARNILFILMFLVFPALQTTLVAITIGGDPKQLTLAVVNEEIPNWRDNCTSTNLTCESGQYSCRFLTQLETDHLKLISFSNETEVLKATNTQTIYGLLTIPANYTQHILDRELAGNYPFNSTLDGSTMRIRLDMSNYIASIIIRRQLYQSLESYGMKLANDCDKSPKELEVPLEYRDPVYGRKDSKYTEYVVPGALVMIIFLLPMSSSGLTVISDKRQGTMDRSMAAGVTTFEMMCSIFVTDGLMIIFQALISTLIIIFGFDFKVEGSYVLYSALCILTGLCGQSWGFVLALICPDEASALLTGFTIHFPMLVAGGIIWPLEGIPKYIRYISHCLPVTASLHSLRSIVARGFGLTSILVWPGFAILCVWMTLAWIVVAKKYKTMTK